MPWTCSAAQQSMSAASSEVRSRRIFPFGRHGDLSATAYLVSQEDLIKGLEVDLTAFLEEDADAVVQSVSADELEVSLLGSRNTEAMRMELYLRVRAWEEAPLLDDLAVNTR